MVRSTLLATAAVSLSLTATEASAHSIRQHHASSHHRWQHAHYSRYASSNSERGFSGGNAASARARGMPWCGAEMADELGIHGQQGRELWLARNWAHMGTATSAHVGAVVVWAHHVGRIVGQENGQWVVRSGNDGGGTRSRVRSIAGAIAIRDVGFGGGGFNVANAGEPTHRAIHVASFQRHPHYQHIARVAQRAPLWMHEETAQPYRFGAGYETASAGDQLHGYVHLASAQRHAHYQHASVGRRTALWMHEEMTQPDRFSAAGS